MRFCGSDQKFVKIVFNGSAGRWMFVSRCQPDWDKQIFVKNCFVLSHTKKVEKLALI